MNILSKRIYGMMVNLPKIVTSEYSGVATIDPLFMFYQIYLKSLIEGLTFTMKFFDSIMTGQHCQETNNSRQSNDLCDNDPDEF